MAAGADTRSPCADSATLVERIRFVIEDDPTIEDAVEDIVTIINAHGPYAEVRRLREAIDLHQRRARDTDGFTLQWCRECGQNWPCPTVLLSHYDGMQA